MTVIVTEPISGPYAPNGVTVSFPFHFKVASPNEIAVTFGLGADEAPASPALYSVSLAVDGEGGSVIFALPPVGGSGDIYIRSNPSFQQQTTYSGEGNFNPRSLNQPLDRSAIRDIWLREQVGRSIQVPRGEGGILLPSAADRAGKFHAYDAEGNFTPASGTGADNGLRTDIAAPNGSALSGFRQAGAGARARTSLDKMRDTVSLKDWALGNGIDNDTAAVSAMFAAGVRNVYVPPGNYLVDHLSIPPDCKFIGSGRDTVFTVNNPGGNGVTVTAPDFATGGGPYEIGNFRIQGAAATGLAVDTALRLNLHDIEMEGFTGANGFYFVRTFGSTFQNLWTNGAVLSNACYFVGTAFNANSCISWYSSNRALYSLLMDQTVGGGGAPAHGNVWVNPCFQSTDYGIFARNFIGATFKGTYVEDVVHPVRLGDASAGTLARGFVFIGGDIQGPYTSGPNLNPTFEDRKAVFDLDYAVGVEIAGMDLSGAFNAGNACPLTITGDGSGAFAVARVYRDGGTWKVHSVEVLCEGTGYTTATVTAGGAGTGATFTATIDSTKIASIAVNAAGSGYAPQACPVAIRYNKAYRVSVGSIYLNSGQGEQSPLYPWIVRAPGAEVRAGVTVLDDISWRGETPRLGSASLRKASTSANYQHVLIDSDESSAERRTLYLPPSYA